MASPASQTHLQDIDLREFSELEGAERAFASLYASGPQALNQLQKRQQRIQDLLADDPAEAEHFSQNMDLIHQWLDENSFQGQGLCVFACYALDYVQGIQLPVTVPDRLRVGSTPYIRPLEELQDEYENFLIVAADNDATRIIEVTSAVADTAERVKGDITAHVRKGGWSQQRYSRRRDKELHHYAKEINDLLGTLVREEGFERIVLLGAQETLTELEDVLSEEIARRVVGKRTTDVDEDQDELLDEAYELFFAEERDEEERLWDRIKNEYLSDGLAVVGAADVLDALKLGRVEELIVTRDAEIAGVRCRECENVVSAEPEQCPICGSDSIFPLDLVDELVRQAELTSAAVEFSDPIPGLSRAGDVAALLRY